RREMSGRKKGLSRERHRQLGLRLAQINDELTHLAVEVLNIYPLQMRRNPGKALERAVKQRREARWAMADACRGEPWQQDREGIRLYFPPPEERTARDKMGEAWRRASDDEWRDLGDPFDPCA